MLCLLCKIQLILSHFALLMLDMDKRYISTKCADLGNPQNARVELWDTTKLSEVNNLKMLI